MSWTQGKKSINFLVFFKLFAITQTHIHCGGKRKMVNKQLENENIMAKNTKRKEIESIKMVAGGRANVPSFLWNGLS